MKYRLIKDYKHENKLRKSFNELTQKVFDFTLEEWYQEGFWGEQYCPYSLADGDKIIANVSVNQMDFIMDGVLKKYIQLGTVMTDKEYRNQGLGRYIMDAILQEYQEKVDGIYLFANDSVLDYYPKFGFRKSSEYSYHKIVCNPSGEKIKKLDMNRQEVKNQVLTTLRNMKVNNNLQMDNYGLYAFWMSGAMSEQIYYCESENAYIVADRKGNILNLNQIIADHVVDMNAVISAFGEDTKEVILGFAPFDSKDYQVKEHKEEDCTLFIMGEDLSGIEKHRLRFPVLSHA